MRSSYPLGSCPNLGLRLHRGIHYTTSYESFRRILKNNVTRYDVALIYVGFVNTEKIQMASSKERFADLLINNKTIIEFGSRRVRN